MKDTSMEAETNTLAKSKEDKVVPNDSSPVADTPTSPDEEKGTNITQYKIINSRSRNRRESNAKSNRSKTPDASNRSPYSQHTYKTRVTLKLALDASADPMKAIQALMKEFLREINNLDTSLVILPWHNKKSLLAPIQANGSLPNTITSMHKYFHKLFIPKKETETTIHPQLMLGHKNDFDILREGIHPWVQSK